MFHTKILIGSTFVQSLSYLAYGSHVIAYLIYLAYHVLKTSQYVFYLLRGCTDMVISLTHINDNEQMFFWVQYVFYILL